VKKILVLFLFPILAFGQQEQWTTLNITGKLDKNWIIAMEGEQRYSWENGYIRYFHYDAGLIRTINKNLKLGIFYREIYEIKKGVKVIELRPHTDAFITHGKHWKWRVRLEYQEKEIDEDLFRFRIRPTYELNKLKQADPFIQTELNFTKYGFTRNRFNAGLTFRLDKFTIQPAFLLESINKGEYWKHTKAIWINSKINF
jgi:hypothetical protein